MKVKAWRFEWRRLLSILELLDTFNEAPRPRWHFLQLLYHANQAVEHVIRFATVHPDRSYSRFPPVLDRIPTRKYGRSTLSPDLGSNDA